MDFWTRPLVEVPAGRPVIVGFPQDEGVSRNGGRVGAAEAPTAIRHYLYRLVSFDSERNVDLASLGLIDVGDLVVTSDLEASQLALAEVVGGLLQRKAIPIVLGGGHETAYGVYLGHVRAGQAVAMLNLDAHLDVRPTIEGQGHSGSPFRQAMEHPEQPLPGEAYACFGAQPFSVSREHLESVRKGGGLVKWSESVRGELGTAMKLWSEQRDRAGDCIHLSVDADVVCAADVPGVSAPNPMGLSGAEVALACQVLGRHDRTSSMELVEINPRLDLDGRSARWGAVAIWNFLAGLSLRFNRD